MAQQNRREIELALEVTTANAEALSQLRDDVKELAKSGGDAAPEFRKLADELGKLEQQARTLETIDALSADLKEAKTSQDAATASFQEAAAVLERYKAQVNEIKAAEAAKNLEIRESIATAQQAASELRQMRQTTDAAGKATLAYIDRVRELSQAERTARDAAAQGRVEREKLKISLREANNELAQAGRAYSAVKAEADKAATGVNALERSVAKQNRSLVEAGGQSVKLGNAQQQLAADVMRVKAAIDAQVNEVNRKVAAEREAAAQAERLAIIQLNTQRQLQAQARAEADGVIRDYQRMEQAQREAAQAAQAAGQRIRDAFGAVGARSVQGLREEIQQVRDAMQLLATTGAATGAELDQAMRRGQERINALERDIREATGSLTLMDRAAGLLNTTLGKLAAFVSLVEVVQLTGRAFLNATKQIESLRLGLNAIYGSAQTAAQQIDVLRRAADAGGVAIGDISQAFVKFSASAHASGIPLEQSNRLFTALTRAAGTLGISSAKTERALEALGQMAAKGVVNMEELRQQLGDALPGALALTAKGLGITQGELFKLVEAGQLTARDLFPALTTSLEDISGEVNTLIANWARLRNTIALAFQAMGDTGLLDLMKLALQAVTGAAKGLAVAITGLLEGFFLVGRAAGAVASALSEGQGLSGALAAAAAEADKTNERMEALIQALNRSGKEARQAGGEMQANGTALEGVALSAETAGAAWVQLGVGAQKANEVLGTNARLAEEAAKAADIEGKARMTLARAIGDQNVVLQTQIEVTERNRQKLAAVAEARRQEVEALRVQHQAAQLIAAVTEQEQQARAASLLEMQKQIDLRAALALRAQEEAGAADAAASAARTAAAVYADNSLRMEELRAAYDAAREALLLMQEQEAQGLVTKAELQAQLTLVSEAQALYNDAIEDAERLTRALNAEERASFDLKASNLRAQDAALRAEIDIARAKGDTYTVSRLQRELTDLQIQQSRLVAEAKRAESASIRAAAEATRADMMAKNQWTAAAEAAYRASIAKAKALENEARIADIAARRLDELAKTTRSAASAASGASQEYDDLAGSLGRVAAASERANNATEATGAAATGAGAGRAGGVTFKPGALRALQSKARAGTLSGSDLQLARQQLETATMNADTAAASGFVRFADDARRSLDESRAMYNRVKALAAMEAGVGAGGLGGGGGTPVNINLGGHSTRVNVASAADAQALQGLLQQLASQSARATI